MQNDCAVSYIASLGTKNYSIQKWGKLQFLSQNAPQTVWRPGSAGPAGELSLQSSLIPFNRI